jgi:hypothetical protein
MKDAGLSDEEMIRRLQDTGQVFSLSSEQENYLRDHGVGSSVIRGMRTMNQENDRSRTAGERVSDDAARERLDDSRDRSGDSRSDRSDDSRYDH